MMITPDLINGLFELFGAAVSALNVKQIRKDKVVHGFNPWTTIFFTSWGLWNLYYYPSLGQMLSFWGGVAIVAVNAVWLWHVFYYRMFGNKCPICNEGNLTEQISFDPLVDRTNGDRTVFIPYKFSKCDSCLIETASTKQMRENKNMVKAFRSSELNNE